MSSIDEILREHIKPKEKQTKLVESVLSGKVATEDFIKYFQEASDVDKGTCADAMKHISKQKPDLLSQYILTLLDYINYPLPRVKWGVPEAIGNMAKDYPHETAQAIPYLLNNISDSKENTTVIKWCAAYALTEIAKYNQQARDRLLPIFDDIIKKERNNGVKNVYLKTLKFITKGS